MMHKTQSQFGLPFSTIEQLTALFKQFSSIQQASIYGSRAKGTYHPGSDIDICLTAPDLSLSEQLIIEGRIDDLLLPWKIDLTIKHRIESAALIDHINRVGVTIYTNYYDV
jgi:predicted nucleotidyltransferase